MPRPRIGLVALVFLGQLACGKASVRPTLSFGAILPYSGKSGIIAGPTENGMRAAVKLVNDNGGLLGHDLALQTADAFDPAVEQAQAQILSDTYHVPAIVGVLDSSQPVQLWAKTNQVVMVTPFAGTPDQDFAYGLFPAEAATNAVLTMDLQAQGARTIVIMAPQTGFGPRLKQQILQIAANLKVFPVDYPYLTDYSGWQDAQTFVQRALSYTPDAVFIANVDPTDGAAIFNALRAQGFTGLIYFALPAVTPPAGIGLQAATGSRSVNPYVNVPGSADYEAFLKAYRAWDNGNAPASGTGLEMLGFDATLWAALAMARAHTSTGPGINDAMPHILVAGAPDVGTTDLALALKLAESGQDIHWHGAWSTYQLDAQKHLLTPQAVYVCCDSRGYFRPDRVVQPSQQGTGNPAL